MNCALAPSSEDGLSLRVMTASELVDISAEKEHFTDLVGAIVRILLTRLIRTIVFNIR
jgi:hypothetical protein